MSSPVKRVLALIVDYKAREMAEALSCQIAEGERTGFALEVLHIDNGNAEPVALSERQKQKGVRLCRTAGNGGYAFALNEGIRFERAQGREYDAYWFLNPDLTVEPACLSRLVEVLDREPRVGIAGALVLKGESELVWGARGVVNPVTGLTAMTDWPKSGVLPRWSYIPGCSLLTRAQVYDEVGGLPERYRLYFEETEFCVQAQKRGWELWLERAAVTRHLVQSMEDGIPARHFAYYFARNNLYFWKHNFGIPWALQLPRASFVVMKEIVLPLRRARNLGELSERLSLAAAGLLDGVEFLRERFTRRERRHFDKHPGDR
jgi:GT2 family glycosyltransferase